MVDEFELALKQLNSQPRDEFEIALEELQLAGLAPDVRQEQERINELKRVPEMINRTGGLPVEAPKTKTFMEGEPVKIETQKGRGKITSFAEGKPVEVRRAQAIDIGGKIVQEPISPDGMTLDFRGNLIKEKVKELSSATRLPIYEYRDKSLSIKSELSKLQEAQQKHEANQLDFLSRLITRKPGVSVDVETGLGEGLAEGETKTVPIQTRTGAAIKAIGDQREFIDNIIGNDKFLDYIKTKGIDAPSMTSRMAGQYLNVGEAPDKIAQLKQNPEVRKLAEEWAMTTPDFMDTATDIFKRAWDGYAGAIGSGTIGPVGLLLKEAGFEESGQALVDAAEYADQQRLQGQDPRKVGVLAQFGRDVSGGLGFTAAAITTGALGNAARASLGLNSAKAISLFQKANTLTFSGLNSAWAGYSEAKSDGATEDQANQAALFSALTQAPLELVSPLQKWISRFDPIQQQAIYRGLNRAAQAVIEGGEEALFNEMPQQIAGNLVKKYVYDPNQDIFEGTAYAGGVGGAAGILTSIFTQMIAGKKAKNKALQGDEEGSEETDIESKADAVADQLAPDAVSDLAQQMTAVSGEMDNLKQEIADDEMGLQAIEKTAPTYQSAQLALNEKKANLAQLQTQFDKLSAGPAEVKKIPQDVNDWDIANRRKQGDRWFDEGMANQQVNEAFARASMQGGQNLATHGMGKVSTLSKGLSDLLGLLTNNIDKNRGGGRLYTAPLAIDKSQAGISGGTASGTSYRDGPFILVQNQEASARGEGITDMADVAAILVNEANIDQLSSITQAIQSIRPDIIVAPYSQADKVAAQLTQQTSPATPTATKEAAIAKIEELNKEFDALDENDQAGIERVNKAIFAEQNKIAELTAIEQGIDPQGTTPTRQPGLPESGRRSPFGTFYPDRPVLQAFMSATDKVIGKIQATGKRAQKLKNSIRTAVANNAGFLAGTGTQVISSEEYNKLTGNKLSADSGTYKAVFLGDKKYLVIPDVNVLQQVVTQGQQQAASRDAALDQESRAASKKLEEEMIHLSMFQGIQDEYKALKKPKLTEQEYIVKRLVDVAKEVKRTNPNALPGVSEVYLNEKNRNLDDLTFSQEFMRMVAQRVRTGQITEDLNAIRAAERETFSDKDKGIIRAWKDSLLNALQFLRTSIARYLGKGTSTKEVEKMLNTMNTILDEYGIVKGEANYEFKDYSAAQTKGEVKVTEEAAPAEAPAPEVALALPKIDDQKKIYLISELMSYNELSKKVTQNEKTKAEGIISELTGIRRNNIEYVRTGESKVFRNKATGEYIKLITPSKSKIDDLKRQLDFLKKNAADYAILPNIQPLILDQEGGGAFLLIQKPAGVEGSQITSIEGRSIAEDKKDRQLQEELFNQSILGGASQSNGILRIETDNTLKNLGLVVGVDGMVRAYGFDFDGVTKDEFDKYSESAAEIIKTAKPMKGIPLSEFSKVAQETILSGQTPTIGKAKLNTPAPVTEQAAPAEAPAPEVAPTPAVSETITPAIEARAGVTPPNADPLGNVRDQFGPRASGHINDNTPEERILGESQALQRGYPEEFATISAKKTILGELSQTATGIRQTLWEHLGDLYHRAGSTTDYGSMAEKVNKFIRWSKNPREFENQLKSNAIYRATVEKYGNNYTTEAFKEVSESAEGRKAVEDASRKIRYMDAAFASMYERLQAFTPLQAMGRNMAIAFGLRRYDVAEQLGKSILSAIESREDSVVKYGFNYEGVNNLSRSNNQTKQQFDGITKAGEVVKNDPLRSIEFFRQVSDRITDEELLAPIAMMEGKSIEARAGVTPEGEPMSKKSESAMKRISNQMIDELEGLVETLKPKRSKALTEYKSKTIQKGKTYPKSLISRYSVAANVFTSDAFTDGVNALNKIFRGNPDADFFRIAQGISDTDYGRVKNGYSIDLEEQYVLAKVMYDLMPAFIDEVNESSMPNSARESFRLQARKVQADLARKVVMMNASGGRITRYAGRLRNIGSAGTAIDSYKSSIIDAMGNIYALTKAPFENIANVIRGDRRKSVDKAANIQSVFRKAVSLIKQSQLNPEKVRQSIRAEVGKKKNASTREILLDFSAGLFDTKEDKYANMIVDQTVLNILAIGMNRKGFSIENVSNFMYQSFAVAAKQMGVQMAGVPKQQKGKRSGKYLEMVKAVIGNDNAYKAFLADLSNRMAEKYQSKEAFNKDFGDLFKSLRSNEWSDSLRTQAIKDATDAINYKFADLFQYLGEKRNAAQAGVREHIRAELRGTGASNELIDKFIADADAYLNQETNRILTEKLGFTVNEETGRVSPKPLMSKKIKEEAEAQFKDIKNLKDITKLSLTDEGNFKEGLISRIITEIGMSKENATELADLISSEMDKALIAQRSENLTTELKKAEEVLTNSKIKRKTNQRTLLQRLIQMANMGMLDSEMVYEAFRQTHDFQKNYLPYDAEFVNTIRQWGDRISLLPEGVIRSIEEEKMGRALLEKSKFTGNDIISSYWYWSLLSQIGTPALNIISGVNNLFANIGVWSLYSPKTAFPMMQALYSAVSGKQSPAVNSFLYVMRNGLNPSGMQDERRAKYPKTNVIESATPQNAPKIVYYLTNFGDGKINFLPDWFNAVLKNVSPRAFLRSLRATDAFLREVAFEARMASSGARPYSQQGFDIARRQAEQELVSSQAKGKQKEQEIVIRANEIYREQRAKGARLEIAEIEQDALETVYNQDPQGAIGKVANFANGFLAKYRATKYIIPFTNVVANVTNEFINYTPGFSQFRLYQARKNGVNDPFTQGRSDKQWELGIKGMLGFAALVVPLIIQAFQSGDEEDQENRPAIQLYAEGPRDPKQQRIWAQNGGIKYSIRIGDKYFSLLGTPLVVPLAMSAMYAEEIQGIKKRQEKLSEIDYSDMAAKVLSSPFSIAFVAVLNQSFLTGVSDILGLTQAKDPVKEGEGIISGILSRMIVPGALRDITKLTTDQRAVGSTWASNLLKEMPGAINFLNKDVNYFGDPARYPSIVAEEGFGRRLASLFGRLASQETVDPAFKIMYDMNLTPPSWDSSLNWSNGKRMTKTQELEFIRSAGPAMRDWIVENEDALRDPELDQEERQNVLSNGISGVRREYKADLETQYQDEIGIDFENM